MTPVVLVEEKPVAGRRTEFEAGTTIGREGCDISLPDPDVSRRHARLIETGAGPAIEDLDSLNGTFINERRIRGVGRLSAGDVVRLGNTVWHVEPGGATRVAQEADAVEGTRAAQVPSSDAPAPAPAPSSQSSLSRGDVPAPTPPAPTPPAAQVQEGAAFAPQFRPGGARRAGSASAARRLGATVYSYGVVTTTAVALTLYFAQR